jgi:hypothetical protein
MSFLTHLSCAQATAAAKRHALNSIHSLKVLNKLPTSPAYPWIVKTIHRAAMSRVATTGCQKYPRKSIHPVLLLVVLSLLATGCSVEPWVQPYERAHLADPIMSFNRDPVASGYDHHVNQIREASRGGEGGGGGGCGCN